MPFSQEPQYPLFALRVRDALELQHLPAHEELLHAGKLVEYSPSMSIIFVSHQWVGFRHPDPEMRQFRVLQHCLRDVINCRCKVETYWLTTLCFNRQEVMSAKECASLADAFIWYDYFSVPQKGSSDDLMKAVHSIAHYVQRCKYFFVLCPSMPHENGKHCDFLSWSRRGWCRLEETAHRLAHTSELVVLIQGSGQAVLHDSLDFLVQPVGQGEFACCEMNHMVDGRPIPCDKLRISAVVQDMLAHLIQARSRDEASDLFRFRLLKSTTSTLLGGLPNVKPPRLLGEAAEFLEELQLAGPLGGCCPRALGIDDGSCGWSALHFAVLQQDFKVAQQLVRSGTEVNIASTGSAAWVHMAAATTPLMAAAFFTPGGAAIRFLVSMRAEVNLRNTDKKSALHMAALGGHAENVRALIEARADPELCDNMEHTSIILACSFSRNSVVRTLVELRADVRATNIFGAAGIHGSAQAGDLETLQYLLDHGADAQQRHEARTAAAHAANFAAKMLLRCGVQMQVLEGVVHAIGGDALMSAALHGQAPCVLELLQRRADPTLRNAMGLNAKDLACLRGHSEARQILEAAMAPRRDQEGQEEDEEDDEAIFDVDEAYPMLAARSASRLA